ncbi:MAG: DUF5104 domain-containing protein [Oscillospiraceae bacterium]|jgi:hypothetical protein|nr:DUF5104 domain-containing protein [Oscillospiraceae bacterium]
MKKRNKFITICLILIFNLPFTSCNINVDEKKIKENVSKFFDNKTSDKQSMQEKMVSLGEEIMKALVNEDSEKILSLLSDNARNSAVGSYSPQHAFDFIDGDIISYDKPKAERQIGLKERGKIKAEKYDIDVNNVNTNSGMEYNISIQYYTILEQTPELEGLGCIIVFHDNHDVSKKNDFVVIGYYPE